MQSLTAINVHGASWHTSGQLILCQRDSSRRERLQEGVWSSSLQLWCFFSLSLLQYCLCDACFSIPSESTHARAHTWACTHTHTQRKNVSCFHDFPWSFRTKESVLASGIYQGWNVFSASKKCLWIWAYSTCVMRKYWIALNFHKFFSTRKKRIIFLYCNFSSGSWSTFNWLKLLIAFLQVQCH